MNDVLLPLGVTEYAYAICVLDAVVVPPWTTLLAWERPCVLQGRCTCSVNE